jgi:putative flippase GtrA
MTASQFAARHEHFFWFAAIGAFSGAVYFISIYVLIEYLALDYRLAVSIAYGVALLCHFWANRQITFREQGGGVHLHLMRYSVMVALNYLTTMAIVIGAVKLILLSAYTGAVIAIVFNLISNYYLSKYWIFRN